MSRVLMVDDEPGLRAFLSEVLTDAGHRVTVAADGEEARQLLSKQSWHLMLTDLKMPRLTGLELLRIARADHPDMEVVVLTAHGTVDSAVEAMRLGAFDYLSKPLSGPDELELVAERALERRRLRVGEQRRARSGEEHTGFVATAPAMQAVVSTLRKVAATEATVLLTGESGVGKEVAARALHRWSPRADGPFVAINCATFSESLLQSELFGHEKGAFTGATALRKGRIELAEGGTVFLDEIGEMKPELQARLLRVLQERSFERVGGARTLEADVRWIAATNVDLGIAMAEGRFREDLYHRLAVFPIALPPLRQRREDILPLAEHLLQRAGPRVGGGGRSLSPAARDELRAYDWPGNVRELANALERAAILSPGPEIGPEALVLGIPGHAVAAAEEPRTLVEAERAAIQRALDHEHGNRKATAARLGISVRSLYDKLRTHGLG